MLARKDLPIQGSAARGKHAKSYVVTVRGGRQRPAAEVDRALIESSAFASTGENWRNKGLRANRWLETGVTVGEAAVSWPYLRFWLSH